MPRETTTLDGFQGLDLNVDRYRAVHPITSNAKNVRVKSGALVPLPETTMVDTGFAASDIKFTDAVFYLADAGNDGVLVFGASSGLYSTGGLLEAENVRGMVVWNDGVFYGASVGVRKYVYDSTTVPSDQFATMTGSPAGTVLGVWQGQLYVASSAMVVRWSDPKLPDEDFDSWPAENTFDLGGSTEREDEYIVAGASIADGFVLFTNRGVYVIYGDGDGENSVVDATGGLSDRAALCRYRDDLYGVNERGVWRTNGRSPLEYVSDKQLSRAFEGFNGFKSQSLKFSNTGWHPAAAVVADSSYIVSFTPVTHPFRPDHDTDPPRLTIEVDLDTGRCSWHDEVLNGILYVQNPPYTSGLGPLAAVPAATYMIDGVTKDLVSLDFDTPNGSVTDAVYELALPTSVTSQRVHAVNVYGRNASDDLGVRVLDSDRLGPDDPATTALTPAWRFDQTLDVDAPNVGFIRPSGVHGRSLRIDLVGGDIDVSSVEIDVTQSSRRRH